MKSDIELLLESQVWKKHSPNFNHSDQKPIKLRPIKEKPQAHQKNRSSFDSQFSSMNSPLRPDPFYSPYLNYNSGLVSPVQVPIFPKLPFGVHSKMLKSDPIFIETSMNSEQLKQIKLENGRIRRAINETSVKKSAKSKLIHSIRLSLKNIY